MHRRNKDLYPALPLLGYRENLGPQGVSNGAALIPNPDTGVEGNITLVLTSFRGKDSMV